MHDIETMVLKGRERETRGRKTRWGGSGTCPQRTQTFNRPSVLAGSVGITRNGKNALVEG